MAPKKDEEAAVVIPATQQLPDFRSTKLPEALSGRFILYDWMHSVMKHVPYIEPDPDYLAREMLIQTMLAGSIEEVFEQRGIGKLQELIPNAPDMGTGPIEVTDLYIASSDMQDGAPCYMLVSGNYIDTGEAFKFSTGATQLQVQFGMFLHFGMWPIICDIRRLPSKDRGGRHLLRAFPVEALA